eukprot:m.648134 g.648134  ORF g.648134 m.648134 type:complete len:373 (+) comp22660_c0_seq8:584-1702(+)
MGTYSNMAQGRSFAVQDEHFQCPYRRVRFPRSACKNLLSTLRFAWIWSKSAFRGSLENNRRCAVIVSGFYEWHTHNHSTGVANDHGGVRSPKRAKTKGTTTPYFVYDSRTLPNEHSKKTHVDTHREAPKNLKISAEHDDTQPPVGYDTHHRPLFLAGLYEPHSGDGRPTVTIITVAASSKFSWLHDRQPAFLSSDDMLDSWLDSSTASEDALRMLSDKREHVEWLTWYAVSPMVGNIHRNEPSLLDASRIGAETAKQTEFMKKWMHRAEGNSQSTGRPLAMRACDTRSEVTATTSDAASTWTCTTCTYVNTAVSAAATTAHRKCAMCDTSTTFTTKAGTIAPKTTEWACATCTLLNPPMALACGACQSPRTS